MKMYSNLTSAVAALASLSIAVGCQDSAAPEPAATPAAATASEHGHEHAEGEEAHAHGHSHDAGPHDGTLADWGGGKYHVEFIVDHNKQEATVYILGEDAKSAAPIKTDKISLIIGDLEIETDLLAAPLDGETDGLASRFVGKHEQLAVVQEYAGTITGEIEGTPYTGDFKEEAHAAHDHK
jgi:hypothetical protein